MSDFIYDDQGKCIAWIVNDEVFTGDGENRRKIATVDPRGNIFSLHHSNPAGRAPHALVEAASY